MAESRLTPVAESTCIGDAPVLSQHNHLMGEVDYPDTIVLLGDTATGSVNRTSVARRANTHHLHFEIGFGERVQLDLAGQFSRLNGVGRTDLDIDRLGDAVAVGFSHLLRPKR